MIKKVGKGTLAIIVTILFIIFLLNSIGVFTSKISPDEKVKVPYVKPPQIYGEYKVELIKMRPYHEAVGTVSSKTRIIISSQIRGIVASVNCYEGKEVKKDEILIKLDDEEYQTKLAQMRKGLEIAQTAYNQAIQTLSAAQANYNRIQYQYDNAYNSFLQAQQKYKSAEAVFKQAEAQYKRIKKFKEKGVATQQQYEEAEARYLQAKAGLEQAKLGIKMAKTQLKGLKELLKSQKAVVKQAELGIEEAKTRIEQAKEYVKEAKIILSYTKIRAPQDGTIVKKLVEPGDLAWPGKPLLVMHDPKSLELEAEVRESLRYKIKKGQEFLVKVEAVNYEEKGKIKEIIPSADPTTRTFLVKLIIPFKEGLFPGMFGTLYIPLEIMDNILLPKKAIQRIGQFKVIYVKKGKDKWIRRYITVGKEYNGNKVEVLSGVNPGEIVAIIKK